MDISKVGAQLVKSISFEVEAIPQENAVEITNMGKMTPLNIRVRVRKKDDNAVSTGIVSIPRRGEPENPIQRLRLASSDMTIMSFNMLMEADLEKQVIKKPRKKFFGICLGAREEKDDDKYLPSTTDNRDNNNMDTTSESGVLKLKNMSPLSKPAVLPQHAYRKKDNFFGKCKPGGCLDPPFGEDKYAYQPHDKPRIKALKAPAAALLLDTKDVETEETRNSKTVDATSAKKMGETLSAAKVAKKENEESGVVLSLYKGEQKHNLNENDSDSIITYPPALSSSGLLLGGETAEKNIARKTSGTRQSRKSFNEFSAAYFSPPRTPRDSKDLCDRAERPKSYSTKDIKQDTKPDFKNPRRASNANTKVSSYPDENQTDKNIISNRTGAEIDVSKVELPGLVTAAVVGLSGVGVAAATTDDSKDGKSKKKQEQEKLSQNAENVIKFDELASTQTSSRFPAAISEEGMSSVTNKTVSEIDSNTHSHAKLMDPYYKQSDVMATIVDDNIQAVKEEDSKKRLEPTKTGSIVKGGVAAGVTGIGIAAAMTGKSQGVTEKKQQDAPPKYVSGAIKNNTTDPNSGVKQFSDLQKARHSEDDIVHEIYNGSSLIQAPSSHSQFGENAATDGFQQFIDKAANEVQGKNLGLITSQTNGMSITEQEKVKGKKIEIRPSIGKDNGFRTSQEEIIVEQFSQHKGQPPKSRVEGIKRLRGYNKFEDEKSWDKVNSQGRPIEENEKGKETFEREQRDSEYSSKIIEDQKPYFHDRMDREFIDSQGQIIQKDDTKGMYTPKSKQRENEASVKSKEDGEIVPQEEINQTVKYQKGDMEREYSPMHGQRSNKYSSKLDRELNSHERMDQGIIDSQEKHLLKDVTEKEYSPTCGQWKNENPSILVENREPYSRDRMGGATDSQEIQREERKYSPTRGQRKNEYSSQLDKGRDSYSQEKADRGTIDSQDRHLPRDNTEKEYSPAHEQRTNEYFSQLGESQDPYSNKRNDLGTINSQERHLSRDNRERKYIPTSERQGNEYPTQLGEDRDPYSQESKDRGITNSQRGHLPRNDIETKYSPTRGQQKNDNPSQLGEDQETYFQERTDRSSIDFQGAHQTRDGTERKYSPTRGQQRNEYSSQLEKDREPYFQERTDQGTIDSQEGHLPRNVKEREYSPTRGQQRNKYSSQLQEDRDLYFQERTDRSTIDFQGGHVPRDDIEREYSPTRGQQRNEYHFKLGEDREPYSQKIIDQGAIDFQGRHPLRGDTERKYFPTSEQLRKGYPSHLQEDRETYSQGKTDQGTIDSQGRHLPGDDIELEYGQRRNENLSQTWDKREPFLQEGTVQGITDSWGQTIEKHDEQRKYSPTRGQQKIVSKLGEVPVYSQDSLYRVFSTDKTGQQANDLKRGVIEGGIYSVSDNTTSNEEFQRSINGPIQKRFEKFQNYEGYDPTSQSDVSAVDIRKAKRQDRKNSASGVTVKPNDQTIGSIFLNLAFQTSNDESQTTIKTVDTGKDTGIKDNSNILLVKRLIKSGKGIVVPISSQHVMNIEIKPALQAPIDTKSKMPKSIAKFDSAKSEVRTGGISLKDPHTVLSIVYNKDLIPLQSVIKDLKEDINVLATQQMMLRDRLATRRIKSYYNNKKCGCSRHSFPKM